MSALYPRYPEMQLYVRKSICCRKYERDKEKRRIERSKDEEILQQPRAKGGVRKEVEDEISMSGDVNKSKQ